MIARLAARPLEDRRRAALPLRQPADTMPQIRRFSPTFTALGLLLAALPVLASAEPIKDMSQGEMDVAQQMIRQHCTEQATKQSGDPDQPDVGVYQSCIKPYVDAINEMVKYQQDPAVSITLWSDCRRRSNFALTGNFPGWAACIAQNLSAK